jgi:hypothetical protein
MIRADASKDSIVARRTARREFFNSLSQYLTFALPKGVVPLSPTTLWERLAKIGAKVMRHGRYITFQLAEVAVSRALLAQIMGLTADLRAPPPKPA